MTSGRSGMRQISHAAGAPHVYMPLYLPIAPRRPIWVMRDEAIFLVDIRSVIEVLGGRWGSARAALSARRAHAGLERCLDHQARETELVNAESLLQCLNALHPVLRRLGVAHSIRGFRAAWTKHWPEALQSDLSDLTEARA